MHIDINGRSFDVEEGTAYGGFWTDLERGVWEPATLRAIAGLLNDGDTFIDIGAWVGPTALYAAACGATVHAYEPDPLALRGLRRNLELNPRLAQRLIVHPVALSRHGGRAVLSADELGQSVSSLAKRRGIQETVDARALGDEVRSEPFQMAKVVKVDIEGGEYRILRQLAELAGQGKVIILSTHVQYLRDRVPSGLPRPLRRAVLQVLAIAQLRVAWHFRSVPFWYECLGDTWVRSGFARRLWRLVHFSEKEFIIASAPQILTECHPLRGRGSGKAPSDG